MAYRVPLVDDELLSRERPTAKVELTEADLRMVAHALSHAAANPPIGWDDPVDRRLLDQEAKRFIRIFGDLRHAIRNANGAAPATTGPRHDPKEVIL